MAPVDCERTDCDQPATVVVVLGEVFALEPWAPELERAYAAMACCTLHAGELTAEHHAHVLAVVPVAP